MFIRNESFSQYIKHYPITSSIIVLHLILFFIMYIPMLPYNLVFQHLAGVNIYIAEGEYWRLVTPLFVHNDFTHLLFNSFSILLFGPFLERTFGKWKFALVYLFCGMSANFATFIIQPLTYEHVGASGAIFGLLGIYLALVLRKKRTNRMQNQQIIIPIIAISIIMTFLDSRINITAHLFGIITGLVIGLLLFRNKKANHYQYL